MVGKQIAPAMQRSLTSAYKACWLARQRSTSKWWLEPNSKSEALSSKSARGHLKSNFRWAITLEKLLGESLRIWWWEGTQDTKSRDVVELETPKKWLISEFRCYISSGKALLMVHGSSGWPQVVIVFWQDGAAYDGACLGWDKRSLFG